MIRETAEELGLDYFKISSSIDVDFTHTSKCKNAEEIVKDASYTVGNVLIGCSELAEDVVTKRDGALRDRVVAVLPPEEENIRMCREAGYPPENIICMTVPQPEILLRGLIEGRNITYGSFGGRYRFDQKQPQSGGGGKYQGFSLRRAETAGRNERGTALEYFLWLAWESGSTDMIHLYYGDGKGKTTAAAGLALRAAGSGRRVIFSQFLKGRRSGEIESFLQIPQVTVLRGDFREKFTFEMNERELKEEAEKSSDLLEEAFAQADSEKADLLVLDEVVSAAERKMISGERLRILIERHRERFEIVLTGRSPSGGWWKRRIM